MRFHVTSQHLSEKIKIGVSVIRNLSILTWTTSPPVEITGGTSSHKSKSPALTGWASNSLAVAEFWLATITSGTPLDVTELVDDVRPNRPRLEKPGLPLLSTDEGK